MMSTTDSVPTQGRPQVVWVFHNLACDPRTGHHLGRTGYQDGHPLVPVATWTLPAFMTDARECLALVFDVFTGGHDCVTGLPFPIVQGYRACGNRGLEAGDVVKLNQSWHAVDSTDFTAIPEPAWLALGAKAPGSTAIAYTP